MKMNNSDVIWIASFDIGKKNFSFYIEEFSINDLSKISTIPYNKRYENNGSLTKLFEPVLGDICKIGKTIILENNDLTQNCNPKSYLDQETFFNMNDLLDSYSEYWNQCDVFVIEKQMSFGKKHNTMALKLGQHCWSYFSIKYGRNKEIVEFPAYYKTQILGSEKETKITKTGKISYKAIDKPKRKKWCINKGLEILSSREGEDEIINVINVSKKKDDLCDVICQLQAFKIIKYIDKKDITIFK